MESKDADLPSNNQKKSMTTIEGLRSFVGSTAVEKCMNKEERNALWNSTLEVYFDTINDLANITEKSEDKAKLLEQANLAGDPCLALDDQWSDESQQLQDSVCELALLRKSSHEFIAQLQNEMAAKQLELIRLTGQKLNAYVEADMSSSEGCRSSTSSLPILGTIDDAKFPSIDEWQKLKSAIRSLKSLNSNPDDKILFNLQPPILPTQTESSTKAERSKRNDDNNDDKATDATSDHKSFIPVPIKQTKDDTTISSPNRCSLRLKSPVKRTPIQESKVSSTKRRNDIKSSPYNTPRRSKRSTPSKNTQVI